MEIIRNLVQNLIVIIILSIFLEMFLPAGEMRKYVKMVMGLLITVAVIQAVGNLIHWDFAGEIPALNINSQTGKYPEIMEAGKKITEDMEQKAIEEYKKGIARQVMVLSGTIETFSLLDVEVKVQTEKSKPGFGKLKEIVLTVGPKNENDALQANSGSPNIQKVEPVTVGSNKPATTGGIADTKGKPEGAVAGLVVTLANFYNLSPEQIKVYYH